MKKLLIIFTILIVTIVIVTFTGIFLFRNKDEQNTNITPSTTPTPTPRPIISKNIGELETGAWIPDWAIPEGISELKKRNNIDSVSPVFFTLEKDGTLKDLRNSYSDDLMAQTRRQGVALIATASLFEPDSLSLALNDPALKQKLIDDISAEVINNDYDGFDFNFESIYLKDAEHFYEVIEDIKSNIGSDRIMSVTVLAKWHDNAYTVLPETHIVHDYTKLSEIADELRIMSYDYTFQSALQAGGISPIDWFEDVAKYAHQKSDPSKVVLGVHLYAYQWEYDPVNPPNLTRPFETIEKADKPVAKGLTLADVDAIKKMYTVISDTYDEKLQESVLIFKKGDKQYIIIYPTERSLKVRKEIAAKYGFKGVYYWRLGKLNNREI